MYSSLANAGSSSPWLNASTSNYFGRNQTILVPFEFQLPGLLVQLPLVRAPARAGDE